MSLKIGCSGPPGTTFLPGDNSSVQNPTPWLGRFRGYQPLWTLQLGAWVKPFYRTWNRSQLSNSIMVGLKPSDIHCWYSNVFLLPLFLWHLTSTPYITLWWKHGRGAWNIPILHTHSLLQVVWPLPGLVLKWVTCVLQDRHISLRGHQIHKTIKNIYIYTHSNLISRPLMCYSIIREPKSIT